MRDVMLSMGRVVVYFALSAFLALAVMVAHTSFCAVKYGMDVRVVYNYTLSGRLEVPEHIDFINPRDVTGEEMHESETPPLTGWVPYAWVSHTDGGTPAAVMARVVKGERCVVVNVYSSPSSRWELQRRCTPIESLQGGYER